MIVLISFLVLFANLVLCANIDKRSVWKADYKVTLSNAGGVVTGSYVELTFNTGVDTFTTSSNSGNVIKQGSKCEDGGVWCWDLYGTGNNGLQLVNEQITIWLWAYNTGGCGSCYASETGVSGNVDDSSQTIYYECTASLSNRLGAYPDKGSC
jgi:hypothetical protein